MKPYFDENNEDDVKRLEGLIEQYFIDCEGEPWFDDEGELLRNNKGDILYKKPPHPPTVTGLALALGFTTRQGLLNYQGKKAFVDSITRAKTLCEQYAEARLFDRDGANGAKFSLANNFKGWSDKQEITASVGLEQFLSDADSKVQY